MNLAKIDVTQENVAILLRNHIDPGYTILNKSLKIAFLFVFNLVITSSLFVQLRQVKPA